MFCFFFNDTATTEIYTLSLHDALPIFCKWCGLESETDGACSWCRRPFSTSAAQPTEAPSEMTDGQASAAASAGDRKSTRLNSSHSQISYAVFCLKKKKNRKKQMTACES